MNTHYQVFDLPGDPNIVVGICRYGEIYVVSFPSNDNAARVNALRMIGRWASNSFLSFDWTDAKNVVLRIKLVRERMRAAQ